MLAKNAIRLTLIGFGAVATLAVLFYPTDEKRVKHAAEAIAAAANGSEAELSRTLETYASPDVSITVAELPQPVVGRAAVVEIVHRAKRLGAKTHFQFEAVEVSIEGKHARVNADLITSLRPEVPELRHPRRSVALFEKSGDQFRLVSAEIGPEGHDQPEARP